jgi:hypothetical protein
MKVTRGLLLLCASLSAQPPSPTYIPQTRFSSGQDVQPTYDGWLRNADGTFTMVFGYLNRNYQQELSIPAGADNNVEPGGADRGQPTYFLPRRQAFIFKVQVPADWGPQKELIWTVTANGRTEKAFGQLTPEEEITERMVMTRGGLTRGVDDPNQPPAISIEPPDHAKIGTPLPLTALVTDDGLPKPRAVRAQRTAGAPGQSNGSGARPVGRLTVTWIEYRGPAKVTFDSPGPIPVGDGKATTTAQFAQAGIYVLRAIANDGQLSTRADVTITVR